MGTNRKPFLTQFAFCANWGGSRIKLSDVSSSCKYSNTVTIYIDYFLIGVQHSLVSYKHWYVISAQLG